MGSEMCIRDSCKSFTETSKKQEVDDINEAVQVKSAVKIDEITIDDSDDPDALPISSDAIQMSVEFKTECPHKSFMEELCENAFTRDCTGDDCHQSHDISLSGIEDIVYCEMYIRIPPLCTSLCSQKSFHLDFKTLQKLSLIHITEPTRLLRS